MANIKLEYGSQNQAVTITLDSLGNGSLRESTAIDNTSNVFIDVLIGGKFSTGTSPTAAKNVAFYAYGTVDGGTLYSGGASGTDAAFSGQEDNLFFLGSVATDNTSDKSYEYGPFSVASAFGGMLPDKFGVIVKNNTGVALHATGSNHDMNYQGVYMDVT